MRDFQRSKCYTWEREYVFSLGGADDASPAPLTLDQCRDLIRHATRRYQCKMPRVTDGRGAKIARGGARFIKLPRWARTVPVILHETAHCIDAQRGISDKHGPVFVRLYIQLLATYLPTSETVLVASARLAGLRVAGRQRVRGVVV